MNLAINSAEYAVSVQPDEGNRMAVLQALRVYREEDGMNFELIEQRGVLSAFLKFRSTRGGLIPFIKARHLRQSPFPKACRREGLCCAEKALCSLPKCILHGIIKFILFDSILRSAALRKGWRDHGKEIAFWRIHHHCQHAVRLVFGAGNLIFPASMGSLRDTTYGRPSGAF